MRSQSEPTPLLTRSPWIEKRRGCARWAAVRVKVVSDPANTRTPTRDGTSAFRARLTLFPSSSIPTGGVPFDQPSLSPHHCSNAKLISPRYSLPTRSRSQITTSTRSLPNARLSNTVVSSLASPAAPSVDPPQTGFSDFVTVGPVTCTFGSARRERAKGNAS